MEAVVRSGDIKVCTFAINNIFKEANSSVCTVGAGKEMQGKIAGDQRQAEVTKLCLWNKTGFEPPESFTRTQAFLTGGKNNVIAASCTAECSPPVNIIGS